MPDQYCDELQISEHSWKQAVLAAKILEVAGDPRELVDFVRKQAEICLTSDSASKRTVGLYLLNFLFKKWPVSVDSTRIHRLLKADPSGAVRLAAFDLLGTILDRTGSQSGVAGSDYSTILGFRKKMLDRGPELRRYASLGVLDDINRMTPNEDTKAVLDRLIAGVEGGEVARGQAAPDAAGRRPSPSLSIEEEGLDRWLRALFNSGQYADMEARARHLLAGQPEPSVWRATLLGHVAHAAERQERLEEALSLSGDAVQAARDSGNVACLALQMDLRASFLCTVGDLVGALRTLEEVDDHLRREQVRDLYLDAQLAHTRGMIYGACAWWDEAARRLRRSLAAWEHLRTWDNWAVTAGALIQLRLHQAETEGPDPAALKETAALLQRVRVRFEAAHNTPLVLRAVMGNLNVRRLLAAASRDPAALRQVHAEYFAVMLNYGSRGEGLLQQPAHASALLDWTVGVSRLGRVLAKVLGPCQEVSDTLDGQAGLLDRALHVSPRLDDLWRERAALHLARDGPEGVHESARCLETAVDLLRAEVAVLTDPQVRAGWLAGLTGLLETLAATAAAAAARSAPGPAAEVPARMVSLAQFLRARGRRDLVRNLRGLQEQTAEEQAEAEELLARVQALQRWLARLDALDRRRAESPSRDVVIIEVVKSRKEHWPPDPLEEVAAEVVHAYPAYAGLTTRGRIHEELVRCKDLFARRVGASAFLRARLVQAESEAPMETAALQAGLAEDELVLDYYLGPSALHVGVIGRTCLQVLSLPTGGLRDLGMLACRLLPPWEREGEVVVKLGERAITLRPREREGEEGSLAEAMRRCSAWLLPPELVALLERQRARRLHVVPSGPLWRVPFAWLEAGGRVALDRWQIDLAPSARLAGRPDRLSSSFQAATVGHPGEPFLRSVQAEVEQVSELLGGQTLFHAKATPRRVLEEVLPRADVIHFACHGTCDPVSPLMSALLLEPDEQHPDGRLIVHRLLGVPLRAAVVSLGACHTARSEGPTSFPESLAHALVGAGVRFVIGSLWAADDAECLHFSRAFYTALKQSRDPAEAFHEAQLEQLQRLRSGASRDDGAALNDEDFARAANFVLISARNERGSTGSPVG